ncbi:MAG TPA: flagellar motor protein [Bryobacteraceae bacterium]|jgi:chemotaxis protein MotA|nr:flagellar motor protein [Bryobacteraceae bacterium]
MADGKAKKGGSKPDLASLLGVVVGIGGIVGGMLLEKGELRHLYQVSAAIIVLGGTFGAVMITTPMNVLMRAIKHAMLVFFDNSQSPAGTIEEIIEYATQARKQGIVSLEQAASNVADPFLKKALNLAVDGIEMSQIRSIMELDLSLVEHEGEAEAKVYEAAGGYAPTIGIIGAVIGLIHVMQNLADIEAVGKGIAGAFVATIYGVASANLFFLPACSKLRSRFQATIQMRELMLEGVLSIVEGLNPKLIRTKLDAYLAEQHGGGKKAAAARGGAGQPVSAEG